MYNREYVTPVGNRGMYVLDTASWRTHRPVMDKALCINCGICLGYCPVNSIKWDEAQGYYISYDFCKGCGICAKSCPGQAIAMTAPGKKARISQNACIHCYCCHELCPQRAVELHQSWLGRLLTK